MIKIKVLCDERFDKVKGKEGLSDDEMRKFDFEVWKEWKRYVK